MIFSKPFYWVLNIKDHSLKKKEILSLVSQYSRHYTSQTQKGSFISNTDWDSKLRRHWFALSLSEMDQLNYNKFIQKKFNKKAHISLSWFNQYYPTSGSEHDFHTHPDTKLANVYVVELEDKSLRTILKHPVTGKEIVPRVKEGQILIFDATIEHRSPKNYTSTRKTVIAFNTDFI